MSERKISWRKFIQNNEINKAHFALKGASTYFSQVLRFWNDVTKGIFALYSLNRVPMDRFLSNFTSEVLNTNVSKITTFMNPSITTVTPHTADYCSFAGHRIIDENRNVQLKYTDYNWNIQTITQQTHQNSCSANTLFIWFTSSSPCRPCPYKIF